MSILVDSTPLISGSTVVSDLNGLGILGQDIPATGEHGASVLYNDFDAGDELKEFRAELVTGPASGSLAVFEDGSYTFTGAANGTYSWTYQLYVDGAAVGTPQTVSMTVGITPLPATALSSTATLSATLAPAVPGASLSLSMLATGTVAATIQVGNLVQLQALLASAATLVGDLQTSRPASLEMTSQSNLTASLTATAGFSMQLVSVASLGSTLQASPQFMLELASGATLGLAPSADNVSVLNPELVLDASPGFELIDDQRITQVAIGSKLAVGWGKLRFSPAAPEEAIRLGFDFSRRMMPTDAIINASVEVEVLEGADVQGGHILHPQLGLDGQQVVARVQGVQPYAVYRLTCVALTDQGDMLRLVAELPGVIG